MQICPKMRVKQGVIVNQNAIRNNSGGIIEVKKGFPDRIGFWLEAYFRFVAITRINL